MRFVVVGGGFGGVKAALELAREKSFDITLISDHDYFLHHATLYSTATGRSMSESVITLQDIFKNHPNVTVKKARATSIDPTRKLLVTKQASYPYDSLILSLGVVTSYFNIKGLARHSYGIKTLSEVKELKEHLHETVSNDRHMKMHYVIVGAGPTGVELAGVLSSYLKDMQRAHKTRRVSLHVDLIEAAPRVLPRLSERASKLAHHRLEELGVNVMVGQTVEAQSDDDLTVNGVKIPSDTVIWTSGVTNNSFFAKHSGIFQLDKKGKVTVDEFMSAYNDVYVIGDNAATPYSGTAYTALHDGVYVAKHLKRMVFDTPLKRYDPRLFPSSIPIGSDWALFEWKWLLIDGRLGSWLRRLIEFSGYARLLPLPAAYRAWRSHNVREEECASCKALLT